MQLRCSGFQAVVMIHDENDLTQIRYKGLPAETIRQVCNQNGIALNCTLINLRTFPKFQGQFLNFQGC